MGKSRSKEPPQIEMAVNASFSLIVPRKNQAGFEKDLKRGELSVNAQVLHGDFVLFIQIYPEQFTEGGVNFGKFSGDACQVEIAGKVLREIDPEHDADLITELSKAGSLSLVLTDISDSTAEPFYKDGDDSAEVRCGTVRLMPSGSVVGDTTVPKAGKPTAESGGKGEGCTPREGGKPTKRASKRDPLAAALRLVFATTSEIPAIVRSLGARGEPSDYVMERQLEAVSAALEKGAVALAPALAGLGRSLAELQTALCTTWLESDIPEGGFELKVRAAEALGHWSVASGEPRVDIQRRLSATRFEHRMWAARAIRAAGWKDAAELLAPLAKDPFCDPDGFYLVREAAGFVD
jgi:hypothetical protein